MPQAEPPASASGPPSPDWAALVGVVVTVVLHFVLQRAGANPFFIAGACLVWATFVVYRARQDRTVFRRWGFRGDNLPQASAIPAALFAAVALGFGLYAAQHGTLQFPGHLPLLFVLYPIWGLIQQFLVLGVVVSNLELLPGLIHRQAFLVLIVAALFAAVHAYDVLLAAGTFLLELVTVPLYLQYRNLWPLGVLHGWLGALFYLWVLGRDLLVENFGSL
jgi:hypothetical protein